MRKVITQVVLMGARFGKSPLSQKLSVLCGSAYTRAFQLALYLQLGVWKFLQCVSCVGKARSPFFMSLETAMLLATFGSLYLLLWLSLFSLVLIPRNGLGRIVAALKLSLIRISNGE